MKGPRDKYFVIYLYEASETIKFMELQNVMVIVRDRRLGEMRSCLLHITFQTDWRTVYMPYCTLAIAGNITLFLSQCVIKTELRETIIANKHSDNNKWTEGSFENVF